jgi:hypothetical protein
MKPITFTKACQIVQKSLACIFNGDALSYPVINMDHKGKDCIFVTFHNEEGLYEHFFGKADEYYITDDGVLEIHKDKGGCFSLQFLAITKVT